MLGAIDYTALRMRADMAEAGCPGPEDLPTKGPRTHDWILELHADLQGA